MPLAAGQRLGSYEILSIIGVGGMGEVYKARDTRLERIVAIKALPDHVASDPDLRQRFEREAKAISSLSHPHICTLHDVGSEGGVEYLVMEYLEGETLAQRLTRGALPLPQTLRYAMEIAEALDRAHRQGVTHRDLKPGNIMLTKSGAKLLDFGLAKLKPSGVVRSAASAATVSPNVTASGAIIGTLQYMAPEQVEGKPVDQRADIFSFGAIVYEMATGQKAFEGETQASLIGAILRAEPPAISALQPLSPPVLDALVATCLAKDPDERWQSAGDVARQLRMMQGSTPSGASLAKGAVGSPRSAVWRQSLPLVLGALVVGAALAAAAVFALRRQAPPAEPRVSRLLVTVPASTPLANTPGVDLAISPDGARIAYIAATDSRGGFAIYVRDLADLDARIVPGSETQQPGLGLNPFFSPDGRSLGFRAPGRGLMRAALGGPPLRVVDDPPFYLGAVWADDDTWIYASAGGLYRVSAGGGGTPERLTPEPKDVEPNGFVAFKSAPHLLPGGREVLFSELIGTRERVVALDLATRELRVVAEEAGNASYALSSHLILARGTTLLAAPVDARLRMIGDAVALVGVRHPSLITGADYALAANGTLAYVPSATESGALVWVDRDGREAGPALGDGIVRPRDPRLSPDGRLVVLTAGAADGTIWVYDLAGRPPIPLTKEGNNSFAVWSPDGTQIAFIGAKLGQYNVYTVAADGSQREPRAINARPLILGPTNWTTDGDLIGYSALSGNIIAIRLADGDLRDLVATPDQESYPALSPDGRWLAYVTDRTGVPEVWVKPYPDGVPVRVSQSGGAEPVWSRDGRELYFRQGSTMFAAVPKLERGLSFENPRRLFEWPFFSFPDTTVRTYDVAPDGRFLMIRPSAIGGAADPSSIVVVQNWTEELKRRAPVR